MHTAARSCQQAHTPPVPKEPRAPRTYHVDRLYKTSLRSSLLHSSHRPLGAPSARSPLELRELFERSFRVRTPRHFGSFITAPVSMGFHGALLADPTSTQ